MSRADALRKLLAVEPLYPDEVYEVMGGERRDVLDAIIELKRAGHVHPIRGIRSRYRLTEEGQAQAFGGTTT